jgi:DNA-binding SARP family transcriptional activator
LDYQLLGPMRVVGAGGELALGGLRQRAVLAALLLDADHTVDVEKLIEMVWDDAPPPKPIASLRAYVANLRRILGEGPNKRLATESRGYRLQLGDDGLDTREFAALVLDGKRLLDGGDAAAADVTLAGALGLWRGAPLSDFRDQEFAYDEIRRLEALRADAVEARFEAGLQLGRSAELVAALEAEVAMNPLRERLWTQLMLALYRAGRRGDALVAYDRLHVVLDSELGVRPGLAVDRLANEIRSESVDLDWTPTHTTFDNTLARSRPRGGIFGRSSELQRLRDAVIAAADGRGGITVLAGDSGVGKTALAAEVADVAASFGMATVWAGHSGGLRKSPMWAWYQVLRTLTGDAEYQSAASGFELIEEIATTVDGLAGDRPILVVLDDLHRADRQTHQVLELLAGSVQRRSLLIVATWQDEGIDTPMRAKAFDRLLSRCEINTIRLRGLDDDAVAQLVEDTCDIVPTVEFVAAVRSRTGGNPFYTKELTRLLHDTGQLNAETRDIQSEDVPDAVAGLIRRRMVALPRAARSALIAAATLGSEFEATLLATILGITVPEAARRLAPALRTGLLAEVSDRPGQYRFAHPLVRDAVATQLTGQSRAQMHAEIARAYAAGAYPASGDGSVSGADHAWRAGTELEPGIALRLHDRAIVEAMTRSAYAQLGELNRRALDICGHMPATAERAEREANLWLQLASSEAIVKGRTSVEALDALRHAFELGSLADHFASAVALRCLAVCVAAQYAEASALSDTLIERYHDDGDLIAGSVGYYFRGLVDFMAGRFGACLESTRILLNEIPQVNWQPEGELLAIDVRSYSLAAWAHAMRGDLERADAFMSTGIDIAGARSGRYAFALMRIADIQLHAMTGRVAGTAERADVLFSELTRAGLDQLAASARIVGGWARALGHDGIDTTDELRDGLTVHSHSGTRIFTPLYLALLSDVEAAHRGHPAARTTLHKAELMAAATGERVWDTQLSARMLKLRADSYRSGGVTA